MKLKQPIFTYLSFALSLGAVAAYFLEQPTVATILALAGWATAMADLVPFTTNLQFGAIGLNAVVLIGLLQPEPAGVPYLGLAILLATVIGHIRMLLFGRISHTTLIGLEVWTVPLTGGLYVFGLMQYDALSWQIMALPAPPLFYQLVGGSIYFWDSLKIKGMAKGGYRVQPGVEAPDFELEDHTGKLVKLSNFRGKRHLLLIFVRGDWCPHCHMMLRTYQRNVERFAQRNIFVMAIGPDPKGVNRDMVQKLGLDYALLADEQMAVASRYGLQIKGNYNNPFRTKYEDEEAIPLPASYLVDINGTVQYVSSPDRVGEFLNPATIFPIVEALEDTLPPESNSGAASATTPQPEPAN